MGLLNLRVDVVISLVRCASPCPEYGFGRSLAELNKLGIKEVVLIGLCLTSVVS